MDTNDHEEANTETGGTGRSRDDMQGKLETSKSEGQKIELNVSRAAQADDPSNLVSVIVKVKEGGYVPKVASLRARIDSRMFTAAVRESDLVSLSDDPLVTSVSAAKRLHLE